MVEWVCQYLIKMKTALKISPLISLFCFSGEVVLVDIEDSNPVHNLNVNGEVTSLTWAQHISKDDNQEKISCEV